ncbi:MAG: hypothetical protein ACKOK7_03290 [Solirubrobacterales bacterium]
MTGASFLILASEASASKEIPFFVIGGIFAAWALLVGCLGTARATFPDSKGATVAISVVSVLLAAVSMALIIVVTS